MNDMTPEEIAEVIARYRYQAKLDADRISMLEHNIAELHKQVANGGWRTMSSYRGGDWVYLFVPRPPIPGNYEIIEGCYMVGLQKWWTRTERNIDLNPTHWRPLFQTPINA